MTNATTFEIISALVNKCRTRTELGNPECKAFLIHIRNIDIATTEGQNAAIGIAYRMGWRWVGSIISVEPELRWLQDGWEYCEEVAF